MFNDVARDRGSLPPSMIRADVEVSVGSLRHTPQHPGTNNKLWDDVNMDATPFYIVSHGPEHDDYNTNKVFFMLEIYSHETPYLIGKTALAIRHLRQAVVSSPKAAHNSVENFSHSAVSVASKGTRERIERIQKVLGLSISRLASILNVQRVTIYSWIEKEINLRMPQREALEHLEKRVELWAEVCKHPPGPLLRTREVNGKTLEAWLADPDASTEQLRPVIVEIARRVEARERQLATPVPQAKHYLESEIKSIG